MKGKLVGVLYRWIAKPIFFLFPPEMMHDMMTWRGEQLGRLPLLRDLTRRMFSYADERLHQTVDGVHYANPVGLAAGFDKDGRLTNILPEVGFGYEEVGSITANAYGGNAKPRLTRLKRSGGILVNYGLKNQGVERIAARIQHRGSKVPLGISVAKTNCQATVQQFVGIEDYLISLRHLEKYHVGDYYTINISCPNTFGGEPFTDPDSLNRLLVEIDALHITKPVYVKLPQNRPWDEVEGLLEVIIQHDIQGVVIANLHKQRDALPEKEQIADLPGGVSGRPTKEISDDLIGRTYQKYGDRLAIIGVGGIFSAEDAWEKIIRGASLVQLITGMIFEGPQLIGEINRGLVDLLDQHGYKRIEEAIGQKRNQHGIESMEKR